MARDCTSHPPSPTPAPSVPPARTPCSYEARTEGGQLNPSVAKPAALQHELLRPTPGAPAAAVAVAGRGAAGAAAGRGAYVGAGRLPRGGAVYAVAVTALVGPHAAPVAVAVSAAGPAPPAAHVH